MPRKILSIFLTVVLIAFALTACTNKTKKPAAANGTAAAEQSYDDVTDLQLALLNSIMFNDSLTEFEGKLIEGHEELINNNYIKYIAGGDSLVKELRGYTLIDYDYGDITGFKAAAFTKGNNLVIAYCGTDHWTDFVDDFFAGFFDFSAMDGQAKAFAKDNVKSHKHFNVYVTGYSMGGRLCYLGAEELHDNALAENLIKVCTFNGLGVKEFLDLTDDNLSNIHNLEVKLGDKTHNYIVEGDVVSDESAPASTRRLVGYNHIGTEIRLRCTNMVDTGLMKQHDLYSIIDFLLNGQHIEEETITENVSLPPESESLLDIDFLLGDWSTSDGVYISFYEDNVFYMQWGFLPEEEGFWEAEPISDNSFYINMEGSSILDIMSLMYGAAASNYHFEVLKQDNDSFYLVQVYGDYTAQSSPCKLGFKRVS